MAPLNPNYVTDSGNKKVAVQLNIEAYEKIEEILESYGLYQLMKDELVTDAMNMATAKSYYRKLKNTM